MPKARLRSAWVVTTFLLAACSSSMTTSAARQEAGGSPPEAGASPPESPLPPPADAPVDIAQPTDSSPDRSERADASQPVPADASQPARADASQPDSGTSGLDAARGQVLWEADPAKGIGVFGGFHMELDDLKTFFHTNPDPTGSSITAVPDGPYPSVWRFLKMAGDARNEAFAWTGNKSPTIGQTYYLGWRFKVDNTINEQSLFQWKSFSPDATHPMIQNHPFMMKFFNGELHFTYYKPGDISQNLWSLVVPANQWNRVVVGIHVDDAEFGGWLQLWWNGVPQNLAGGGAQFPCRTFDSRGVMPKWGVYGANKTTMSLSIHALKMGTTFEAVDPR
jgi:hypothetical protein